jgi:hypothetical protein
MVYSVKNARRLVAAVALAMWLVSLALPAGIITDTGFGDLPGILVGAVGLLFGFMIFQFGAFANPLFLLLVVFLLAGWRAWISLALLAEILALSSFTWSDFPSDNGSNPIAHFGSGFYLWQAAILLLTVYALCEKRLIASGRLMA